MASEMIVNGKNFRIEADILPYKITTLDLEMSPAQKFLHSQIYQRLAPKLKAQMGGGDENEDRMNMRIHRQL